MASIMQKKKKKNVPILTINFRLIEVHVDAYAQWYKEGSFPNSCLSDRSC